MSHSAVCWQCGASLAELSLPLSRFDHCKQCQAALHACRLCQFFAPGIAKQCREPIAEEVRDKSTANFCDYFSPGHAAFQPADVTAAQQARAQLESLFGNAQPADTLKPDDSRAATDAARVALNDLFGSK